MTTFKVEPSKCSKFFTRIIDVLSNQIHSTRYLDYELRFVAVFALEVVD